MSESAGPVTVTSSVKDFESAFAFRSLIGFEEISQPFRYDVEVLCAKAAVPIKDMVGSTMTVHMNFRSGGKRHFNGYVTDFSLRGVIGDRFVFAATLRPWLHMLSLRVNCCIHKGSAIDIVKGVCSKYSSLGNLKPDIAPPDGGVQPPVYEFVVQYRETDLSFVSRILEREGLYYYFTHDEAKHEMVVTNVARLSVKGYEEIVYQPASTDNEAVPEAMEDWRPHFSYTPDTVTFEGSTSSFDAVNRLAKALEQSPLFRTPQVADAKMSLDGSRVDFRLNLAFSEEKNQ